VDKESITFRLDPTKKKALDDVASLLDRDRSYILNQAVDQYLDLHRWQVTHIRTGLREAKAGKFAPDRAVAAAFARFRRRENRA